MKQKAKLTALFLLGIGLTGLQAQSAIHQSVNSSGGTALGSGGTATYSVGQVFYTYSSSTTTGDVSPGIQQAYEIYGVGIDEIKGITLKCSVYPNPTVDLLKLNIENYTMEKLKFQLYDVDGKLIQQENVTRSEVSINMGSYVSAVYFLKVSDNSKIVKTFKIIKN